jgi:hypothetical protein
MDFQSVCHRVREQNGIVNQTDVTVNSFAYQMCSESVNSNGSLYILCNFAK